MRPVNLFRFKISDAIASFDIKRFSICLFTGWMILSCSDENVAPLSENKTNIIPRTTGLTILGDQLDNPFEKSNVRAAYSEMYSDALTLPVTHYYVRFLPTSFEEVKVLADLDIPLEDTPLDYEIVSEGDFYHDPGLEEDDFTWLYGAVPVGFTFPDVEYEILQDLILVRPDSRLYFEI